MCTIKSVVAFMAVVYCILLLSMRAHANTHDLPCFYVITMAIAVRIRLRLEGKQEDKMEGDKMEQIKEAPFTMCTHGLSGL